MREPDWASLADIQFLLYNRIADSLNAALSGIALSDMPEAQDRPPGFWKHRASAKISNVLNMFTAWSYLVRYKMGETIPDRVNRPFRVNTLLMWLGEQLQLNPPPQIEADPLLRANQETLQEALLLLYSVAYTQGTNIRLELDTLPHGMWFRVKFQRNKPLPATLDALLMSFGDHWRAQDTLFELSTARDFVRLNGGDLVLNPSDTQGEFVFYMPRADTPHGKTPVPAHVALERTYVIGRVEPAMTVKTRDAAPPPGDPAPDDPITETPVLRPGVHAPLITPVLRRDDAPTPPRLADLRPTPGSVARRLEALAASSPEGTQPSAEPPDPASKERTEVRALTPTPVLRLTPPARPKSPEPPGESAAPRPTIVPAKIPDPRPPAMLRTPPASTSHVALPKETQTLTPVEPEDAPPAQKDES